jgi:hypothetical protein
LEELPMTHARPNTDARGFWPTRLDHPGEFIAALPAMLGFLPERSLAVAVLCAMEGEPGRAVVDLVVRFDLYDPETGHAADAATIAAAAARICARPEVVGVLAVVIDDAARMPESAPPYPHRVLDDLERQLAATNVPVRAAWAVTVIAAGQPWWSLRTPQDSGYVPDPDTSVVAFRRVLDGSPSGSRPRSDLTALVTPDPALHKKVSTELDEAVARAQGRYTEAANSAELVRYRRSQLATVLRYVSDQQSAGKAPAQTLAKIAVALREKTVRDSLLALADSPHAQTAEQLWAQLTRAVSGEYRAEAATLLGYFAYVRGDGPLAGIALDAALEADPLHTMAALMHTALEAGMRPGKLRELSHWGREAAIELGVTIPSIQ